MTYWMSPRRRRRLLKGVSGGVVKTVITAAPVGTFTNWGQTNFRFDELTAQTYGELP